MKDLLVLEKGYTVIYDSVKGEIGYIGIDDHSGDREVRNEHRRTSME